MLKKKIHVDIYYFFFQITIIKSTQTTGLERGYLKPDKNLFRKREKKMKIKNMKTM